MPRFQLLRCDVALAGEKEIIVSRHRGNPVAYPELLVLQYLHGGDAISDIAIVGEWDATNEQVLDRLRALYAETAIEKVFPGNRPNLPLGNGSFPRCNRPIHVPERTKPDNPDPKVLPLARLEPDGHAPVVRASRDTRDTRDTPGLPPVPVSAPGANAPDRFDPDPPAEDGDGDRYDLPRSEEEIQQEMEAMFGAGAGLTAADETGSGYSPPSDAEIVQRTISETLLGELERQHALEAKDRVKAKTPDPAAYRAADKTRGKLTDAATRRSHPHDVAGGGMKAESERDVRGQHGQPRVA